MRKVKAHKKCLLFFNHKIAWDKSFGYRCKMCGKTPLQIRLGINGG